LGAIPTRKLGKNGPEISRVGFGAWAIGGGGWSYGWGPQDDDGSLKAMRHAVTLGINWIDTAAVYGLGHSEELVGRLLKEFPAGDRPYVFTKGGLVWDEKDRMAEPRQILRPESIRRECEASLRRLGVERIDLYQFHWPDETGTPVEDSWDEMVRLVEEGKVRWHLAGKRLRFVDRHGPDGLQHAVQHIIEIMRPYVQLQPARLDPREIQQIVDHCQLPPPAFPDTLHELLLLGGQLACGMR
jgi:hypothetical protein